MTGAPHSPPARGERTFRALLRLYPAAFRRRYQRELVEAFRRDRGRPVFAGWRGALRFWRHTVADVMAASRQARAAARELRGDRGDGRLAATAVELRRGFRLLRRQPGFSAVAIGTLALAVAAVTTVYGVADRVLRSPLPYPTADNLVRIYERERDLPDARMVAYGNYRELRARADRFRSIAAWVFSSHVLTGTGEARTLRTRGTTANFADVLEVSPSRGRWFTPAEETAGASVVVLAHDTWLELFGGDDQTVGRTIRLDGEPYDVIGVMPPGADYPSRAQAWYPLRPVTDAVGQWRWHRHNMIGRLAGDAPIDAARAQLSALGADLEREQPVHNARNFFEGRSLSDDLTASRRPALLAMLGAVGLLLMLAVINLASLLVARALREAPASALRAALGASRARLAGIAIAESIGIALAGGLLGLVASIAGIRLFVSQAGVWMPAGVDVAPVDAERVVLALGVAMTCGLAAAIVPAWQAARAPAGSATVWTTRASAGRRALRARRLLLAAQLTIAFVLVAVAGLFGRSLATLMAVDPGVESAKVLTLELQFADARYPDRGAASRAVTDLLQRLEGLPGVERAAATLTPPVADVNWMNGLTIRDEPRPLSDVPAISYVVVTSGYFDVLGVPVTTGEMFRDEAGAGGGVAVVNDAAARRYFGERGAVGREVLGSANGEGWSRVIGVVGDIRQTLREPAQPEIYVPMAQDRVLSFVVLVRTSVDPLSVAPAIREAIARFDPDAPIGRVAALDTMIQDTVALPRLTAGLVTVLAALALMLAAAGVFGVASYSVAERRREFGIRLAIGATRARIFRQVLSEGARLAAAAVVMGGAIAAAVGRAVERQLFQVAGSDPASLALAAVVLVTAAVLAGWLPARSATRADPSQVLRES